MSSTHAPADVAVMMVEACVAKHRTRPEVLLLKAVRALPLRVGRHADSGPVQCGHPAVLWRCAFSRAQNIADPDVHSRAHFRRAAQRYHGWRVAYTNQERPGHRQDSVWFRVPGRSRHVRVGVGIARRCLTTHRIVLQGQELLTSNMMVRTP